MRRGPWMLRLSQQLTEPGELQQNAPDPLPPIPNVLRQPRYHVRAAPGFQDSVNTNKPVGPVTCVIGEVRVSMIADAVEANVAAIVYLRHQWSHVQGNWQCDSADISRGLSLCDCLVLCETDSRDTFSFKNWADRSQTSVVCQPRRRSFLTCDLP